MSNQVELREVLERLVEACEPRRVVENFDPTDRVTVIETRTKDIIEFHEALDNAVQALATIRDTDGDAEMDTGLEAILAKDDTEVMLDELRELFGADLDVDSRFTVAQVITAMERSFQQGADHANMVNCAKETAAARLASSTPAEPDEPTSEALAVLRDVRANFWVGRIELQGQQEYLDRTWDKLKALDGVLLSPRKAEPDAKGGEA